MKKLNIQQIISILMLIVAVGFNLWLYRLEPTATIDPNDNTFQFALVDRTNQMWDFALRKCSSSIGGILTFPICHFSILADHWVPNWAQGYNLPYYYSHIPQITIVLGWRFVSLFVPSMTLFQFYHGIIYLLMCFFPISVFLALLVAGLPWITAGVGALFAMNLSTDGLYGLDPSSFLWRGYGLSSQLFAMIWFPLALAYAYRFFMSDWRLEIGDWKNSNFLKSLVSSPLLPAILLLAATTAGHLGIGMIAMISVGFLAVSFPIMAFMRQKSLKEIISISKKQVFRLAMVAGIAIFLLSYWIIPTLIHDKFHNISFWDPVWKFDSYGAKEVIIRLFNGDLFDFGRLPVITYLTILGSIVCLYNAGRNAFLSNATQEMDGTKTNNRLQGGDTKKVIPACGPDLSPFSFLFFFWVLFYFGRTTWGGLIDLIPGMKEFHLSRFLVGVHTSGMILAPIGFVWFANLVTRIASRLAKTYHFRPPRSFIRIFVYSLICLLLIPPILRWSVTYNELNERLIIQANENYAKAKTDEQKLFSLLRSLPTARIYAGRGGSYGKKFEVAETAYFMHLSTYGLQTTLWLPETWSMNSDTEQFFSEDQAKDYDLYNMRWVVAPPDYTPQSFWEQVDESPSWKLYEVPTSGYFTTGVRPAIVASDKRSFFTVVHLWIQSNAHNKGLFPELTYNTSHFPRTWGLPNFKMIDEVTYVTPDGKRHNLWTETPVYLPPNAQSLEQFAATSKEQYANLQLLGPEENDHDMTLKTTVEVGNPCEECIVVLKETFHPGWKLWVDGRRVTPFITFPFFIGIPVAPGTHTIIASYEPSTLKVGLLVLTLITIVGIILLNKFLLRIYPYQSIKK
jgi:hypothetical protein